MRTVEGRYPHAAAAPSVLEGDGPRLRLQVAATRELEEGLRARGDPLPNAVVGFALIDTGAAASMIDADAAASLGLKATGTALVGSPTGGAEECPLYAARIMVLLDDGESFLLTEFAEVPAGPLSEQQGLICLLGRDVLRNAELVYNGREGYFRLTLYTSTD